MAETHAVDELHDLIAMSVPGGSRVLAVAPDPALLERLAERNCRTWTLVAHDSPALRLRGLCQGVTVGDLDSLDLGEAFPDLDVDAVVLMGVLGHVAFPAELLRRATKVLTDEGQVVASVPNATYAVRRVRFWEGAGEEEEAGPGRLLLRAFNRRRIEQLLSENGLSSVETLRVRLPTRHVLGRTLPPAVLDFLAADEDADVDHWVVIASPAAGPLVAPASVAEELQRRLHRAEDEVAGRQADLVTLEQELGALQLDLAIKDDFALQLRGQLHTLERRLAGSDASLAEARVVLDRTREQLSEREHELDDIRHLARRSLPSMVLDRILRRADRYLGAS